MSLLLLLLLHCTAVAEESLSIAARDGREQTLPCRLPLNAENNCEGIKWIFTRFNSQDTLVLTEDGKIQTQSDRRRVAANCSLVVEVRVDDAGQYSCRRVTSSGGVRDATVVLAVVTMTKHNADTVSCSLEGRSPCDYNLQWLCDFSGDGDDDEDEDTDSSQPRCSASKRHPQLQSGDLCRCKVTNLRTNEAQMFTFSPPPTDKEPDEKPGEEPCEEPDTEPDKEPDATTATAATVRTPGTSSEGGSTMAGPGPGLADWWLYLIAAAGLVLLLVLILILVVVFTRKRTKRRKTKMAENTRGQENLNDPQKESDPDPSRHQATVEPDDGVTLVYASVSYTKNTQQTPVKSEDDDEGDAVTYSAVKTSATRANDDPSNVYATVVKSGP